MSFCVDIVTEDSFYENLTLGVVKILENSPCVRNVRIERRNGCESGAITNWEQRHCCALPEDIRNFYASIDGFLLQWNLDIAGEEFSIGRMEIGGLASLKRYVGKDRQTGPSTQESTEIQAGNVTAELQDTMFSGDSRDCKLFEIGQCFPGPENGRIYLAYRSKQEQDSPSIWLHRGSGWYHLADNFTVYFRMMLAHLGLPLWQCCVTGLPLPTWVEQAYFLVGPHLLPSTIEPTETVSASLWNNGPINVLDPAIFKAKDSKQRNARKK
ncbi:PREDICTED: tubulin polyglutamylase complex subunit 2 [Cyphomyrmex costatus]|uniref:Tubulin polyglutamylase complex subunit 2 n=1 Tax=Cyphomyrmex costatus TaxID=456900 RepID=A0A195CSZ9_9HYME|nr:PREDICTED: tubulin polyglutamylase complex subunit 2 [Cyphomyrmex costatus]KYN03816.1 Tubulin polyglutamylase complex subunit 2 [Cyphomyrmex costatus]